MSTRIAVMVIDDSAVVRQVLGSLMRDTPGFELIGAHSDPVFAQRAMQARWPDVIVLDVEMPRMDGITFLRWVMATRPTPVVICSTLTEQGSATALAALEKGAVDILTKPKLGTKQFFEESCVRICDVVKSAAQARLRGRRMGGGGNGPVAPMRVPEKLTADAVIAKPRSEAMVQTTEKVAPLKKDVPAPNRVLVILSLPAR